MLLGYSLVVIFSQNIFQYIHLSSQLPELVLFFHPQKFCQVAHMTAYDLKKISYKTSLLVPILRNCV